MIQAITSIVVLILALGFVLGWLATIIQVIREGGNNELTLLWLILLFTVPILFPLYWFWR